MIRSTPGSRIYDISRTLQEGIPVWPGDPQFRSSWAARIRDGAPCNVSAFSMGTHTGTHIDAPLHLHDEGDDVVGIDFNILIGPARVVSFHGAGCIRTADLEKLEWNNVKRVLFKTRGGSRSDPGYLDEGASIFLVKKGIRLVGIDAPSVDPFDSTNLISHRILLDHGTVILENAELTGVPEGDYELVCLPLKLAGMDGSPVRAILLRNSNSPK
jgi:arylformamidase